MTTKMLDQAIGCWTTSPDAMAHRITLLRQSVAACRRRTIRNQKPALLREELVVLRKRLLAMVDLVDSAIARCDVIIENKETGK